jgi:hypothetical protein
LLALLPEHREVVCVRLRGMVNAETGSLKRVGLLLLLGLAGDGSEVAVGGQGNREN